MLTRLGWFTVRRRRPVLAVSAVFVFTAAAIGTGAFGVLEDGGFEDPDAESTRAADILEELRAARGRGSRVGQQPQRFVSEDGHDRDRQG